jgi:hypothetical protein
MVMKKAFGDDSPLQQGVEKSFWTLPISGQRRRRLQYVSWMDLLGYRVFAMKGIYRRKGNVRGRSRGPHHLVARPGDGPCHPMVRLPPGPSSSLLWTPASCQVNRNFGFCFVQFREYFLCNFSQIQKQQKTGTGTMASC